MLKPKSALKELLGTDPAAFGRLCVETKLNPENDYICQAPAAFGRLCVETIYVINPLKIKEPAAFGRLCVETTSFQSD